MTPPERAAAALQAWAGDALGLIAHLQAEAVRLQSRVESLETESTVWRNRADALREAYRNALSREVEFLRSQEGQEPEGEPPPSPWDAPCTCGHLHDRETATGQPWPSCGLLGCDCRAYQAQGEGACSPAAPPGNRL